MARVFVSHSSQDRECAGQLHQWLNAEGHEVFLAWDLRDGIPVGDGWEQRLHERLRWADAVVCVVPSAAVASPWCSAEIGIALSRGSRLLPVRAEPYVDHPLLGTMQYADLTVDPSAARAALIEALRRIDAGGGWGWPDDQSPFPGLRPFDIGDHRVFFGRTDETRQIGELLRSPVEQAKAAMLLVVGPSGCGKSSLVRAGLIPAMAGEPGWLILSPIFPGADPVRALARELAAVARRISWDWKVEEVHHRRDERGLDGLADELLLASPGGPSRRLLIVVDQIEELLTQTAPAQRGRFVQLLRPALAGPVQVVGTLRSDFIDQLLADSHLADLATTIYCIRSLHREALRMVIQGPARLAGIAVSDDLVARVVADTDTGEALSLLAHTLSQLAYGVQRREQLAAERYDQLGGVQGALIRRADAALAEAVHTGSCSRKQVIAGLLRLVTVDHEGRPTRCRINRSDLPDSVAAALEYFVRHRLLVTETTEGSVILGVAHDALLSAWSPLAQEIAAKVSALRARWAVEQAATEWNDRGRSPEWLWDGRQLGRAVAATGAHVEDRDLVTDHVGLSSMGRIFLYTSLSRNRLRLWPRARRVGDQRLREPDMDQRLGVRNDSETAQVNRDARTVFLSYRRDDTKYLAGWLADRLRVRLGSAQVFMDVYTIEPGTDFVAAIVQEVASCAVLIALIGPTWSTITDEQRRRRIDDPDDLVVLELRAALEYGKKIIPVLVDGAVMPDRKNLPEGLHGLARLNGIRLDYERFESDVGSLLNTVERILSSR